jgi:hypothetical protein
VPRSWALQLSHHDIGNLRFFNLGLDLWHRRGIKDERGIELRRFEIGFRHEIERGRNGDDGLGLRRLDGRGGFGLGFNRGLGRRRRNGSGAFAISGSAAFVSNGVGSTGLASIFSSMDGTGSPWPAP